MLLVSLAFAVEGMWLPGQLGLQEPAMRKAGLQAPISEISDPKGALLGSIVHVGGYCSGSFVSQDGLILTNHHCAWEFLQANTTAENNRLQDGYLAKSRAEELSGGPDARLYIMEKDEDVTSTILRSVKPKMSDVARQGAIEEATAKLLDSCEKGRDDIECEVTAEHGGLSYRLLTHRVLRDVRIVFAPPMTVGSFGGDLDNFEWPRHDGDFAILRAYVGADGSAREFDATNVPYKPAHFLKVQPEGISPGEFVMVAGFPGSTQRYELLSELNFLAQTYYPQVLQQLKAMEAIVAEERKKPEGEEKLGATAQELANYRKYVQGILDNVNGSDVLARKEEFERGLREWVGGMLLGRRSMGRRLRSWTARFRRLRGGGGMIWCSGRAWGSRICSGLRVGWCIGCMSARSRIRSGMMGIGIGIGSRWRRGFGRWIGGFIFLRIVVCSSLRLRSLKNSRRISGWLRWMRWWGGD